MIFPPFAWQDVLVERQRNARLELFQLAKQGAYAEVVRALQRFVVKPDLHDVLHKPDSPGPFAT